MSERPSSAGSGFRNAATRNSSAFSARFFSSLAIVSLSSAAARSRRAVSRLPSASFCSSCASPAFCIARIRSFCSFRRAADSLPHASESKGTARPSASSATPAAAAVPATNGLCRRTQRPQRSSHGSFHAVTGSSASQRSMSSASPSADSYRSRGSSAIARRQIASSAGGMAVLTAEGGRNRPCCYIP